MHRRSLTCISRLTPSSHSISSGGLCARSASTSSQQWASSSSTPHDGPTPYKQRRRETGSSFVPESTKRFSSGEHTPKHVPAFKQGWRKKPQQEPVELKPLPPAIQDKVNFASPEVQQFNQTGEPDLTSNSLFGDLDVGTLRMDNIPVGSFVEIRRSEKATFAVYTAQSDRTWKSITMNGVALSHLAPDIQFVLPGVIDPSIASRCGVTEVAENDDQLEARRHVIREMRALQAKLDQRQVDTSNALRMVYEHFRSPNPDEWSQVTVPEVARFITGDDSPSVLTLFSAYNYLMLRSTHFVADLVDFLSTQRFHIRPKQHVQDIEAVAEMIEKQDPRMDLFFQKARKAMAYNKKHATSWKELPSMKPLNNITFDPADQQIIRFLSASVRKVRFVQTDPYVIPMAYILKKLQIPAQKIEEQEVADFLTALGVRPPWEDIMTKDLESSLVSPPGSPAETMGVVSKAKFSVLQPLGSQDYYPHDVVASIRHDFGNLPVYVIDDFGAQELDDGVSIEPPSPTTGLSWIHVHIADPTALIPPTHDIAKKAYFQGHTCYFPHTTVPMLPKVPEVHALSLGTKSREGLPENVMTFSFLVDKNGDIAEYKIRPGVVRNVQILRYDDADAALGSSAVRKTYPFGGAPPPPPCLSLTSTQIGDLKRLRDTASRMTQRRNQNGAMQISFTVPSVNLDVNTPLIRPADSPHPYAWRGMPQITYAVENTSETGFRQTVAEAMKAAARVASMFCRDHGIPVIRRVLGPMRGLTDEAMTDLLSRRDHEGSLPFQQFVRSGAQFDKALLTTELKGHSQLGVLDEDGYAQVTSPLRRFYDMLAHWQLKHFFISPESPPLFSEEWLKTCALDLALKQTVIKKMDNGSQVYWSLKFIQHWIEHPETRAHLDDPLESLEAYAASGPVTDVDNFQKAVCIVPKLGLRGTIKFDKNYAIGPGDIVPVKLRDVRIGFSPRVTVTPK